MRTWNRIFEIAGVSRNYERQALREARGRLLSRPFGLVG